MKKLLIALAAGALLALVTVSVAFAAVPPGQLGYEGQPGNQGGWNQAGQGSFEGQPGNQSHN